MKKLLGIILVISVSALSIIYLLIPAQNNISSSAIIRCNINAAYRYLANDGNWQRWWPGSQQGASKTPGTAKKTFTYDNLSFQLQDQYPYSIGVALSSNKKKIQSQIHLISLGLDSIGIQWSAQNGQAQIWNPIERVSNYFQSKKINTDFIALIAAMNNYLKEPVNVYAAKIEKGTFRDTALIATRLTLPHYPNTGDIYNQVSSIKKYIASENAHPINSPLVNIYSKDSITFQLMVAIAVDRVLKGNELFFPRRMVPGNFLVAETTGGTETVKNLFYQMNNYLNDYGKTTVAIPFQLLLTDRSLEPDTSKWATRIYYPIY
jgi:hypothetical protein